MTKTLPAYLLIFIISYGTAWSLAVAMNASWGTGSDLISLDQDGTSPISDPFGTLPVEEKNVEEFQLSFHDLAIHDSLISSMSNKLPFATATFAPHQMDYPVTVPPPDFG